MLSCTNTAFRAATAARADGPEQSRRVLQPARLSIESQYGVDEDLSATASRTFASWNQMYALLRQVE